MKIKHLLAVVAMVAITKNTFAQYSQDAIRFSTSQYGSTARIKALGNATTAIGGDLSNISANPAGLGYFTKSEISITPEYDMQSANASYLGLNNNTNTNTLNFNNAAGVIYGRNNTASANKSEGWLSLNFGASYNRTNDFYQGINYSGTNANNSITNYYADLANNLGVSTSNPTQLQDFAYRHNLIDQYSTTGGGSTYLSNVFNSHGAANQPVNQNNSISREGGQNVFSLAMGANYSNKLYIGVGLDFTSVRYNSFNTFNESGLADVYVSSTTSTNSHYVSSYIQNQETTGSGFAARLGVIYKPVSFIRFGATISSPTYYLISDDYSETLQTFYTSGVTNHYSDGPTDNQFSYTFHTPWKVSGGVAIFAGNFGFITADVDYLDYSAVRLNDSDDGSYDASADNHDIQTYYKSTVNAHFGAEVKLSQLYLRGGYGIQGNPDRDYGSNIKTISGGLGYRFFNYYIDATYTNVQGNQTIFPYITSTNSPQANVNNTYNDVFLTLGVRF